MDDAKEFLQNFKNEIAVTLCKKESVTAIFSLYYLALKHFFFDFLVTLVFSKCNREIPCKF